MLSHLHRAAELKFPLYINWAKNRTMIAIGRMQVAEREALYPSRTFNANDDDNNDNIFIHTIQVQWEKNKKKKEAKEKRNW